MGSRVRSPAGSPPLLFLPVTSDWPLPLWRSKPSGEGGSQAPVSLVSDPCHRSVGPDQDGIGSSDRADDGKLPRAEIFGVDQLNPICPRGDIEAPLPIEVEQQRPGIVQQRECALGTV